MVNHLHIARTELRLLNLIVDFITIIFIWIALSSVLIVLGVEQFYVDQNGVQTPLISLIIFVPIFWSYYIICESVFQRTLGKVLTKTKVVDQNNSKPAFGQILGRTFSRSIPFEYLSYIVSRNGIHDRLSGTYVVRNY